MRASFWVIAPLLARMHEGQGFAAGRLRDRHAARGSADHGAGETRRELTIDAGYVVAKAPAACAALPSIFPR
jgi:UDP-N-acetylglucosamine 1-carboxyvinyltransferase